MSIIPDENLKGQLNFNFAPMIDFLFLMLALFATLAMSRSALQDAEIDLVQLKTEKGASLRPKEGEKVHLSITETGSFKWMTEFQKYPMENVKAIQEELVRQYQIGALAQDKTTTQVLLHIDQKAPWSAVADAIFAIKEVGFNASPVYEHRD